MHSFNFKRDIHHSQDLKPPLNGSPPPLENGGVSDGSSGVVAGRGASVFIGVVFGGAAVTFWDVGECVSGTNAVDDLVLSLSIVVLSVHGTNLVVFSVCGSNLVVLSVCGSNLVVFSVHGTNLVDV